MDATRGSFAPIGARFGRFAPVAALLAVCIAGAAPAIAVIASLAAPFGETINHVLSTLGMNYALGTLALCLGVGLIASAAGVGAAMLTALCDFPLRRFLSPALALPLATPAYIAAYAYADLLGPFGALAPAARAADALGLPDIRSLAGAIFILSATLYPYAYLAARAAFASRSSALMETARTLGATPFSAAMRVLLPATRPAIAGAAALIMMETAAEFGVADYFGVPTLSVGIFRTWHSFGDLAAASQLASGLFLFALLLVGLEAAGRRGRTADAARGASRDMRFRLSGAKAFTATAFCAALIVLGFITPVAAIVAKIDFSVWDFATRGLGGAFSNSIFIAGAGAAVTLFIALGLSYAGRSSNRKSVSALIRIATLGYAIPGAVIAIGVLSVFSFLSEATGARALFAAGPVALIYAYAVRFLTAGYNTIAGGFAQIDPAIDGAARMLGAGPVAVVTRVHAPLLRKSIAAAAVIVVVDIVKELPATLILRDFNFETLATRVYRLAGDERLREAAPDALMLIVIAALPVLILNSLAETKRD